MQTQNQDIAHKVKGKDGKDEKKCIKWNLVSSSATLKPD